MNIVSVDLGMGPDPTSVVVIEGKTWEYLGTREVYELVKNARELPGALAPLLRDRDFVLMAGAGDIGVVAQEVGTRGHLKEGKA